MGTPQNLAKIINPIVKIGDSVIHAAKEVRNIGAIFTQHMKMDSQLGSNFTRFLKYVNI